MIRHIFFAAKINLLGKLPVPIARKWLQRIVCGQPLQENSRNNKQLLIDVSLIIRNDRRTGIQRVVRALLLQLLKEPPKGYQVRPVFATHRRGYCYAPDHFGFLETAVSGLANAIPVTVGGGDIYLGLDLVAHLFRRHQVQLAQWKCAGAELHILLYDLIPVMHPQWYLSRTTKHFRHWLRTVAIFATSVICISNVVKNDFDAWLRQQYSLDTGTIPINIISLGADIQASAPSRGLPDNVNELLTAFSSNPTLLMVGTLEPRKGHDQVLAAIEKLWEQGRHINLVILGKPGWKTKLLQKTLRAHPQHQTKLYWFDNASDELLELLYTRCTGVVVASYAEGFGLPLVEALHHNKPVFVRDIPIFREIAENYVTFFSATSIENFANELELWLSHINDQPTNYIKPQHSWEACANELLDCLRLKQSASPEPRHA
jgi:glycosyltransferase involved in cell wall biosynthesis